MHKNNAKNISICLSLKKNYNSLEMTTHSYLTREAKAFVKRTNGPDEVIRVVPDLLYGQAGQCYQLYTAFEERADNLGCILFDAQGFWIYDGELLSVAEQEQLADFIINYVERL
ncbi:hypothetical protein SNE25_19415 [Mucilaginibacter sabulilitoris]|uniref:Uncharacterized protein n=1 Tax=Mucilaginibacter sabulilitoris TaxID=1173583 RepID=A0ABZ0TFZ0_9SPHI|nr:hypothetical protein [Mucilaginibacter sabulilitoris]WPU91491.1 hypothetical protein SNE25_19415 [Mucilaginibacter sabulilitoris]